VGGVGGGGAPRHGGCPSVPLGVRHGGGCEVGSLRLGYTMLVWVQSGIIYDSKIV
jgi:hypothetical protein